MSLFVKDLEGAEALHTGLVINRPYGYGVVDGAMATAGADPFDVDIPQVTVLVDEVKHTVGPTQINLRQYVATDEDENGPNPRKVAIYVDTNGDLQVRAGTPEPAKPDGEIRWNTYRPALPDFLDETDAGTDEPVDGTPLYGVWIGANDERVTDKDLKDLRLPSRIVVEEALATTLTVEEFIDGGGTRHTGEIADASDVPAESDILAAVNADSSHGTDAQHNYRTDTEIQDAVIGTVDAADLRSDTGTSDQFLRANADGSSEWADVPALEAPVVDTGVVTHTGGGSTDVTILNVSADETQSLNPSFYMESGVGTAHEWNYEYSREWTGSQWNINVTFTWDAENDPGTGTDASIAYVIYDAHPQVVSGRFTSNDAIAAMDGASITPDAVDVTSALELPVYDDLANHIGPTAGDVAVATGAGPDAKGLFLWDTELNSGSGGWVGPFATGAPQWSDVTIDSHKNMGGYALRNLAAPQNAADAARKSEVDAVQSNLDTHESASDPHSQYLRGDEAGGATSSVIDGGTAGQVLTSNGYESGWASPPQTHSLPPATLAASGEAEDDWTTSFFAPNGVTILGVGVTTPSGSSQSAVEVAAEVVQSSAAPHTTKARYESASEFYGSPTAVTLTMRNTTSSAAQATAVLRYRFRAPF